MSRARNRVSPKLLLSGDRRGGQGSHCVVLWRGEGLLRAREMMDLLFALAGVGLLTKRRGESAKQAEN